MYSNGEINAYQVFTGGHHTHVSACLTHLGSPETALWIHAAGRSTSHVTLSELPLPIGHTMWIRGSSLRGQLRLPLGSRPRRTPPASATSPDRPSEDDRSTRTPSSRSYGHRPASPDHSATGRSSGRELPQSHDRISARGRQPGATGAERDIVHARWVYGRRRQRLARAETPDPSTAIVDRDGEQRTIA